MDGVKARIGVAEVGGTSLLRRMPVTLGSVVKLRVADAASTAWTEVTPSTVETPRVLPGKANEMAWAVVGKGW